MSQKSTLILGIESSCDDTAAALVADGRVVLSSAAASQIAVHQAYGGVVPEIASRCHAEAIDPVVSEALRKADVTLREVDAIAVTAAPGLVGSLLVGVSYAKGLAYASGKPLVPVHHIRSHIASVYPTHPDLTPPFLALVVSGGHSHIIEVSDYTSFRVLARTRDDAAGECFDKTARVLGFPYPGGVYLDKASKDGDPTAFSFPKCRVEGSDLDFSFSGLKTAVINTVHTMEQKGQPIPTAHLAASVQATIAGVLTDHLLLAAKKYGYRKIVLAGGVAANSGLRDRVARQCAKEGYDLYLPEKQLCGDNGVMVASQGYYEYRSGVRAGLDLNAAPTMDIADSFPGTTTTEGRACHADPVG